MVEIKYISYGLACRIENIIYLNENLKKYPELHDAILKHEKAHSSGFVLKDLVNDVKGKHLNPVKLQYYKFILKHPKSLATFIPVWFYEGNLSFDPLIFIVWILLIIMFKIIWWVL